MSSPPTPTNPTNGDANTTPAAATVVSQDGNTPTPTSRTKRSLYSPQAGLAIAIEKNEQADQRKKSKYNGTKPKTNNVKLLRIMTEPDSKDTKAPIGGIIIIPHNIWAHKAITLPVWRDKSCPIKKAFYSENSIVARQVVEPSVDGKTFYVSGTYFNKKGKEVDIKVKTMAFACPPTWTDADLADYINNDLRPTWLDLLKTPSGQKTGVRPHEVPYCMADAMDIETRQRWGDALPRYEDVVMCVLAGLQDKSMTFKQWVSADPDHVYSTCWAEGEIPMAAIRHYGLNNYAWFTGTQDEKNWTAYCNGKRARQDLPTDDYEQELMAKYQKKLDAENAELEKDLEKST